jgi:hypothetical protein
MHSPRPSRLDLQKIVKKIPIMNQRLPHIFRAGFSFIED